MKLKYFAVSALTIGAFPAMAQQEATQKLMAKLGSAACVLAFSGGIAHGLGSINAATLRGKGAPILPGLVRNLRHWCAPLGAMALV